MNKQTKAVLAALTRIKKVNPAMSDRAIERDGGICQGTLSQIRKGKIHATNRTRDGVSKVLRFEIGAAALRKRFYSK